MTAKKIVVVFFAGANGVEPVREWLISLSKTDRIRIGENIREIEFEWSVRMPLCRPLGQGLYEVRTRLKDRIARVLFGIEGSDMVLLHGFIKKSQTTPKGDLALARKRLQLYRSQE